MIMTIMTSRRALAGVAACVALTATLACTERARELLDAAAQRAERAAQQAAEPAPAPAGAVVLVSVTAPGYAPEEVERLLTVPLEEALAATPGLERLTSTSREGEAQLQLTMEMSRAPEQALVDARARVDEAAQQLPSDAEQPVITLVDRGAAPDFIVTLDHDGELVTLRTLAREFADRQRARPEVARVELCGGEQELRVELDPHRLAALGMTIASTSTKIEAALRARDIELPGARPTTRAPETIETLTDEVLEVKDGAPIRLGDLASIELAPARSCEPWTSRGAAVSVALWRAQGAEDADASARALRAAVAELKSSAPATITLFERPRSHHFELRAPAPAAGDSDQLDQLDQLATHELPRVLEGAEWTLRARPSRASEPWSLIITSAHAVPELDQTPSFETIAGALRQLPGLELRALLRAGEPPPRRVAVLQGPELATLHELARELSRVVHARQPALTAAVLDGATRPEQELTLDSPRLAALGVTRDEVLRTIELASGGRRVGTSGRGPDATPIILVTPRRAKAAQALLELTVQGERGAIPLRALVELRQQLAPVDITREDRRRGVRVEFAGPSLGERDGARTLERAVSAALELPPGYTLTWRSRP